MVCVTPCVITVPDISRIISYITMYVKPLFPDHL